MRFFNEVKFQVPSSRFKVQGSEFHVPGFKFQVRFLVLLNLLISALRMKRMELKTLYNRALALTTNHCSSSSTNHRSSFSTIPLSLSFGTWNLLTTNKPPTNHSFVTTKPSSPVFPQSFWPGDRNFQILLPEAAGMDCRLLLLSKTVSYRCF